MPDYTNSRYRYFAFKNNNYRRFTRDSDGKSLRKSILIPAINNIPAHGTYGSLLFDPRWRAKREIILKRDLYSCVVCQGKDHLQVHHRQYQFVVRNNQFLDPWDYEERLLITLCESCHKKGHNKYKVPTINI